MELSTRETMMSVGKCKTIVVTGRGSTGKSTFTDLITKLFGELEIQPMLLVDSDPDNLPTYLSVKGLMNRTGYEKKRIPLSDLLSLTGE